MASFNFIFRSVFFFFCIWTLVWLLGAVKGKKIVHQIDNGFTKAVILLGIIHIVSLLFYCFHLVSGANGLQLNVNPESQIAGKYWFGFWIYPFTYFFLTQLLWFKKVRLSKLYRGLLAIWILIVLNLDYLVINMAPTPANQGGIYI